MHRAATQHNRGRSGSFAPLAQDEPDLEHGNGHETEVEADEEVHSGRHRLSGRARFQQQVQAVIRQSSLTHEDQLYEPVQPHHEYSTPLASPRLVHGSYGSPPEEFQEIDIAELAATHIEYYGPRAPSSLSKESDVLTESTFVDDKDKFFCCAYETPIVGVDEKSDPQVTNRPAQGFADYRPFVLKSHFSLLLLLMLGALLGLTVYSTHVLPTENQLLVPPNPSNSRNGSMAGLRLRGMVPVRVFGRASVAVKLGRAGQDGNATQPEEQPQEPTTPTLVPTQPVGGTSAQTHPSPGEGHTTTDDSPGKLPPPSPTSPEIQTSPTDRDGGGGVPTPPFSSTTGEPPKDNPPKPTTAEATSPTAKPTTTEATSPTEAPSPTETPSITETPSTTEKPTTIEMTSPTEVTSPTDNPGTTEVKPPTDETTTAKLTSPMTEPSPTGVPSPTETTPPPPPPPPTGAPGGQKSGTVCTDTFVLTITKTTTLSETTVSTSPIDRPSPSPSATPAASQALPVGNASPLQKQPTPLATSDPDEVPPLVLGVVSTPLPATNTPPLSPQQQKPESAPPRPRPHDPENAPKPQETTTENEPLRPFNTPSPQVKKPQNTPLPPHTITVVVVSQSTIIYTDWTETDDFMTWLATTLTDAAGNPTATKSSLVNMAPFLTTYTDAEGRPTRTGTAWHQNQWRVTTKTNGHGGYTTETYATKLTTSTLSDAWGRATSTSTGIVTETLAVTTLYGSNGVPTMTKTMWEPVTSTSTAIITSTLASNSSRDSFASANISGLNVSSKDYFVGLVLPPFLAVAISIPVRMLDQTAKLYQPFHALTKKYGAETVDSLCLQSSSVLGFVTGVQSLMRHHILLSVTGLLLLINAVLIPLSAEAFRISVRGPDCSSRGAASPGCDVTLQAFPTLVSIATALLSAMMLLAIIAAITLRKWKTGVWKNPWSMEVMGLLATNGEFRALMKRLKPKNSGVITNKDAIKAFGQRRFGLKEWYDTYGWEYGVLIKNDAGNLLKGNKKHVGFSNGNMANRSKAMPFYVLSLWGRLLALLLLVALLVVSLVYISTGAESKFAHFMDGDSFGVRFLFCGVGVVVSLFWATFFNGKLNRTWIRLPGVMSFTNCGHLAVAFLSPYRLYRKHYDGIAAVLTPPTNAYSGLWEVCQWRRPDGYLGLVAFTAILSDVLPVLLANVPSKALQASATHLVCTWIAAAILSQMLVVITWSFLVDWPPMSMDPSTVAGAMYFALDPGTFMGGYSTRSSTPGGRSSQV
ncbi:uncharacterized protein PG986_009280 [Apiospora aurea]|uniref:Uncharacterized protein n=1 Tax=Apiospora aurea TaxID=335848 RepID=A0ABR1Q797_9PEZI